MAEWLLAAKDISHAFGKKQVLTDVNLQLTGGEICGLVGRNGVGKTVLMNILAGTLKPAKGITQVSSRIRLLSSDTRYPGILSLQQLAALHQAADNNWSQTRWQQGLGFFELEQRMRYGSLSSGQRAAANLVLFMALQPQVWLLDEITLGLDLVFRKKSLEWLLDVFSETSPAVLYCTHYADELERLADRLMYLEQNTLQAIAPPTPPAQPFETWLTQTILSEEQTHA